MSERLPVIPEGVLSTRDEELRERIVALLSRTEVLARAFHPGSRVVKAV